MFKNMKIEINKDQPLDDVVKELERLGFSRNKLRKPRRPNYIDASGSLYTVMRMQTNKINPNTTLTELKNME
jgi:hypothetical protein